MRFWRILLQMPGRKLWTICWPPNSMGALGAALAGHCPLCDTHGESAIGFTRFPFSYTYRDYVIEAFHQDLPYDRFIMEQLAADSLGLPNQIQPWRLWVS